MLTLAAVGLVGGFTAGISPCVLPVLPVVFLTGGAHGSRRARPHLIVAGLTLSFSAFTLLGAVILSALSLPEDAIRWAGIAALVLLGVCMFVPRVQRIVERPFARLGTRRANGRYGALALGVALGAVYVPCAGPVLAAISVAGATGHIGAQTLVLTAGFAVGMAAPLLAFALGGRRITERVRAFRERQRGVRAVAGVAVIALAVALALNATDAIQRALPDYTAALSPSAAVARSSGTTALRACAAMPASTLQDCGRAPRIAGIRQWFNTPGDTAISAGQLRGKVVLVDFWAYSCINCQRAIPHIEAWYRDYAADGFVVIGVQTPEYAFEHVPSNVAAGIRRLHISYPVALDDAYTTWNNFGNDAWPADYLIDATGQVRNVAIGEGNYATTERLIRQLLSAAHPGQALPAPTDVANTTPTDPLQSPETYLGAERASYYSGGGHLTDGRATFTYPASLPDETFALTGTWTVGQQAIHAGTHAGIELRFHASTVYLDVGGTGTVRATTGGTTTTLHISGAPDIYPVVHLPTAGQGTVVLHLSAGLAAYSFTFG